jgi:hypothetical protein
MATILDGRTAAIYLIEPKGTVGSVKVAALRSITLPSDQDQIDTTTIDDVSDGYRSSRPGLKTGQFTFDCLWDNDNTDLIARIADGADVDVFPYLDDSGAQDPYLAWTARLAGNVQTNGVGEAVSLTVTVYRKDNVDGVDTII